MMISKRTFSREERAEQIKACCETIIENAFEIAQSYDEFTQNCRITIDIPCREVPTITVTNDFISRKVIDCMTKRSERVD